MKPKLHQYKCAGDSSEQIQKEKRRMAEMNIKQIIDRLNVEFTDTRKFVFW